MANLDSINAQVLNRIMKQDPALYQRLLKGEEVNISNDVQTVKTGSTTGTKTATVTRFRNVEGSHELLSKWYEWTDYSIGSPEGTKEWLQGATTDEQLQSFFVWVSELVSAASSAGLVNRIAKKWRDYSHAELAAMQRDNPQQFSNLLAAERKRISDKHQKR